MYKIKIEHVKPIVSQLSNKKDKEYRKVCAAVKTLGVCNTELLSTARDSLIESIRLYRKGLKKKELPIRKLSMTYDREYPGLKVSPVTAQYNEVSELVDTFKKMKISLRKNLSELRIDRREVMREDRIVRQSTTRDDETFSWDLLSGVHTTPNKFLEIKRFQSVKQVFKDKGPKTADNHVGVELEFFCKWDKNKLARALFDEGLTQYVTLKTDSSIKDFDSNVYISHELCVLSKDTEYKDVIKRVTQVLAKSDARINKSCGTHVHLDMRNRNKEVVFANLVSAQPQLYAMNPSSREDGTYCKKTEGKSFSSSMDRYHGINGRAYTEHKTIEVRIHSGTIDYTKITNWIDILLSIANKTVDQGAACRSVNGFVERYSLSDELKTYIESRIDKFTKQRMGEVQEEEVA